MNGKSGLLRQVRTVLGSFAIEGAHNQWSKGKTGVGNEHSSHKMRLEGKRFLLIEEPDKDHKMNSTEWKKQADGGVIIGRASNENEKRSQIVPRCGCAQMMKLKCRMVTLQQSFHDLK